MVAQLRTAQRLGKHGSSVDSKPRHGAGFHCSRMTRPNVSAVSAASLPVSARIELSHSIRCRECNNSRNVLCQYALLSRRGLIMDEYRPWHSF
jgi:hypothetical protein